MTIGGFLGIMRYMFEGHLNKMATVFRDPVEYNLKLGFDTIDLNPIIGKQISIRFLKQINCINCGKITKKSYAGGHCFPCSQKLASCDLCVLTPVLCHYAEGTCREPSWGESHCMIPHYVYLANTSGLKVGITRTTQIPTRWIDQGAICALPIIKVATRFHSGIIEKMISEFISDKTDWRKMLKGETVSLDLISERDSLFEEIGALLDELEDRFDEGEMEILENETVVNISYPILKYPPLMKSLKLDTNPEISGTLLGIKGQYLLLDCGVFNIRNHTGYLVDFRS